MCNKSSHWTQVSSSRIFAFAESNSLASACLPPEAGPTSLAVQQGLVESPLRAADRAAELPSTTGQRIASDIDDQLPHASLTLPQMPTLTRTLRGWLDEMLMSACSASQRQCVAL